MNGTGRCRTEGTASTEWLKSSPAVTSLRRTRGRGPSCWWWPFCSSLAQGFKAISSTDPAPPSTLELLKPFKGQQGRSPRASRWPPAQPKRTQVTGSGRGRRRGGHRLHPHRQGWWGSVTPTHIRALAFGEGGAPRLDRGSGKSLGHHPEEWLRLRPRALQPLRREGKRLCSPASVPLPFRPTPHTGSSSNGRRRTRSSGNRESFSGEPNTHAP